MGKKIAVIVLLLLIVAAGVWFLLPSFNSVEQPPGNEPETAVLDEDAVDEATDEEGVQEDDAIVEETVVEDEDDNSTESEVEEEEEVVEDVGEEVDDTAVDAATFDANFNFVSSEDGFQFRNYTSRFPEGDLTIDEARQMFGDVVCTRVENDRCVPHPKVTAWLDATNETMDEVGHCTGFTVSSGQLHSGNLSMANFDDDMTFNLPQAAPVLREISQAYASYYATNVWKQEVQGTPTEILEALMLLDEPVDIGIFQPEYGRNGHSVLGHDVIDQGEGIFHIMVYDSNRPGEENVIVINTNDDSWYYAEGAVNPDQPFGEYMGNAETLSLSFIPMSAYNEELACPADFAEICPATEDERFTVVTLVGNGRALVESAAGQIGDFGGQLIKTLTESRFLPVRAELYSDQFPIMVLSADETFTVQATTGIADEALSLSVANPAFSVVVEDLVGQPEQIEQLVFDPVTQQADFVAGGLQRPSFSFTYNQGGEIFAIQVLGLGFEAGQTFGVTVDGANGDLQLETDGLVDGEAIVLVTRLGEEGEAVFANQAVTIAPDTTQALDLDGWDGVGGMTILTDAGQIVADNVPVAVVLEEISLPETTIDTLQLMLPYLDGDQTGAVAATLPNLGFSGEDLGSAYQQLPTLQPEDLAGTLRELPLGPDELGALINALRLDITELEALIEELGLDEESTTAVVTAIVNEELVRAAVDEWEFQDTDDPSQLPAYLDEFGLDGRYAGEFISEVELPQDEVSELRRELVSDANADACSVDFDAPNQITFINDTSEVVALVWVDYDCVADARRFILPGESHTEGTFATHPWQAVYAETGEPLPIETPTGLVYTYVNNSSAHVTVRIKE